MQEKTINNNVVRRSNKWSNYGSTRDGRVFRWDTEKEMSVSLHGGDVKNNDHYFVFRGSHDNKVENIYLHVFVADCWLENQNPELYVNVNHKDGNKRNPCVENLEWCSRSQNQHHALSIGLKQKGEELYNASLTDEQVHLVCQKLQEGYLVKDLSEMFDTSKDVIRKIKDGSTYFHIRRLYPINHNYKEYFSESTVRWVCEKILEGLSDKGIANISTNKNLTTIDVKRIRNKIRYMSISNEYF